MKKSRTTSTNNTLKSQPVVPTKIDVVKYAKKCARMKQFKVLESLVDKCLHEPSKHFISQRDYLSIIDQIPLTTPPEVYSHLLPSFNNEDQLVDIPRFKAPSWSEFMRDWNFEERKASDSAEFITEQDLVTFYKQRALKIESTCGFANYSLQLIDIAVNDKSISLYSFWKRLELFNILVYTCGDENLTISKFGNDLKDVEMYFADYLLLNPLQLNEDLIQELFMLLLYSCPAESISYILEKQIAFARLDDADMGAVDVSDDAYVDKFLFFTKNSSFYKTIPEHDDFAEISDEEDQLQAEREREEMQREMEEQKIRQMEEERQQQLRQEEEERLIEEKKRKAHERRLEQEKLQREREERERLQREKEEKEQKERMEKERLQREKAEKERLQREREERERLEKERIEREERERLEREQEERDWIEREQIRLEQERQRRLEQERLEREQEERLRLERERLKREKEERERQEKERRQREQEEYERLERERLQREKEQQEEKERLRREEEERERLEQERIQREIEEAERLERERVQREAEEKERERLRIEKEEAELTEEKEGIIFNQLLEKDKLAACQFAILSTRKTTQRLAVDCILQETSASNKWYNDEDQAKYGDLICSCIINGYTSELVEYPSLVKEILNGTIELQSDECESQFVAELCLNFAKEGKQSKRHYLLYACEYLTRRVYGLPTRLNHFAHSLILVNDYLRKRTGQLSHKMKQLTESEDAEELSQVKTCRQLCQAALQTTNAILK